MWTKLHWVEGPWAGRLALAARPRGGDWLDDEMAHWRDSGVDSVVSLLEHGEEEELELARERLAVSLHGMTFHSLPIVDRGVPESEGGLKSLVGDLDQELSSGKSVTLHCRQGVGRTGLVAVCLFMARGFEASEAIVRLSDARGMSIPETTSQRQWINQHADAFSAPR